VEDKGSLEQEGDDFDNPNYSHHNKEAEIEEESKENESKGKVDPFHWGVLTSLGPSLIANVERCHPSAQLKSPSEPCRS
jgi:hypothetical protein